MKTSKNKMIHIGIDWGLRGDSLGIALYKRRITKEGDINWDIVGSYNDFHDAYHALVKKEIGPLNDVKKIISAIEGLENTLQDSIYGRSLALKGNPHTQGGEKMRGNVNYHNTNRETGDILAKSEKKARSQEDRVLAYFQERPQIGFTVHHINRWVLPEAPHHSCQRAVTNLTKDCLLVKTDHMRLERYGKKVHTWMFNKWPCN